jgi:Zn-dependent protease with chaperone function
MGIYADKLLIEQKQQENFMQVLNEVYFGRGPKINALFNAYCDWREPFISSTKYYTGEYKNVYNKDMQVFRDMVCKQFGFKTFSYNVLPIAVPNSFTMSSFLPLSNRTPDKIIIDKNGYRFKDNTIVSSIVAVFPELIFNPEYSNEENFAIFLHEIGHNFQSAVNNTMFGLKGAEAIILAFMGSIPGLLYNDYTYTVVNAIQNKLSDIKVLSTIYSCVSTIVYALTRCKTFIQGWSSVLLIPIGSVLSFVYRLESFLRSIIDLSAIEGYYGERFADGFAASYGFGEALSSALRKMDTYITVEPTVDDLINKCPIVGHIMNAACLPGMMLCGIIDVHPSTASRCYSIIKDLKTDLNDPGLSPELKKQLKKEIDSYENTMHKFFDVATKAENPRALPTIIQKWMYEKGGDLKFKISELPFNKIGGFRAETNRTKDWIKNDNYTIKTAKII